MGAGSGSTPRTTSGALTSSKIKKLDIQTVVISSDPVSSRTSILDASVLVRKRLTYRNDLYH